MKGREIRSFQLDNQSLPDELTELKSCAQVLTIEVFENNQDEQQFYTVLCNWTVFKAVFVQVSLPLPNSPT